MRLPKAAVEGLELFEAASVEVFELLGFFVLDVKVVVAVVVVLVDVGVPEPPEAPNRLPPPESPDAAAAGPATNAQSSTEVAAKRRQPITAFKYDKSDPSLSLRLRG
jgi:hypothetical protein